MDESVAEQGILPLDIPSEQLNTPDDEVVTEARFFAKVYDNCVGALDRTAKFVSHHAYPIAGVSVPLAITAVNHMYGMPFVSHNTAELLPSVTGSGILGAGLAQGHGRLAQAAAAVAGGALGVAGTEAIEKGVNAVNIIDAANKEAIGVVQSAGDDAIAGGVIAAKVGRTFLKNRG